MSILVRKVTRLLGLLLCLMCMAGALAETPAPVRIGVLAKRGEETTLARWAPTAAYLDQMIPGRHFEIVPLGFDEVFPATAAHRVDFMLVNSALYVMLESRFGASRIATLRNIIPGGSATRFGGVIFTRADRGDINDIADLRGRRFAAVDANSFGGYMMAWRAMAEHGLDPRRDLRLSFAGTHDAVVYAVLNGTVAAGTVRTDTLERMAEEGKLDLSRIKVIHPERHAGFPLRCSTRLYPEWPIARLRGTPEALGHLVASALLQMPADSEAARAGQVAGWTVPRNYQPVHELMRELRIGPYADLGKVTPAQVLRIYGHWLLLALLALLASAGLATYLAGLNRKIRHQDSALREARDHLEVRVAEQTGELMHTVRELEQSNERLELARRDWNEAFDAIQHPIFIHDEAMTIVQANPAYCERAGLSMEQLRGRPYWEVFPKLAEPLGACRQFPEEVTSLPEEVTLDGGGVLLSRSFSIRRADGSFHNAIHILEDVTEERRAAAEMRMLTRALEQAGEGVMVVDPDGRIQYANPALSRLLGVDSDALQGRQLAELGGGGPRARLDGLLTRVGEDGGWHGEAELGGTGGNVPVFITASTLDESGVAAGYVLSVMDLTQVRSAEAQLQYRLAFESIISGVSSRFATVGWEEFDRQVAGALGQIGEFVGIDRAYLFLDAAGEGRLRCGHAWPGPVGTPAVGVAELAWMGPTLGAGETLQVEDVTALEAAQAEEVASLGIGPVRSLLHVPLMRGDRLYGFIGFADSTRVRVWADEDVRMLRAAGAIINGALRRREAELEVRDSERNLATAEQIAHLGNWVRQIPGEGLAWSDETYRIFGLERQADTVDYARFLALVHPDDRDRLEEVMTAALAQKSSYSLDYRVFHHDGGERIVHEKGRVETDPAGEPRRLIGSVQDVTAVRHAQAELTRLNRALRTLSRGNETLVRAVDEKQLLNDICRVLIETGGYRLAWVGYPDPAGVIRPVGYAGDGGAYLERVAAEEEGADRRPAACAVQRREACVARGLSKDPAFAPWHEQLAALGYEAEISLPLNDDGRTLGALTIDTGDADAFDEQEVALLTELANDLAFGIRAQRLLAERDTSERALAESRERYRALYEGAPTGYASVSADDGRIVQCNDTLCNMLGYDAKELLGQPVFSLYQAGADGSEPGREVFGRFQAGEAVSDAELCMLRKDGTPLWVSLSVEPVLDAHGQVRESRSSISDISARKAAEQERRGVEEKLRRALVQTIQAIAVTIEKRDPYTAGHQQRVAALAVLVAREMGLDEARIEGLRLGALIHDIGKIYVPAEILNRPGRLTETEFQIIQTHPQVGYEIIRDVEFSWPLAQMVLQHHERIDGSGYPEGLKGEEILLEARILAVADVVEAMASHRPYRPALAIEAALDELESHRGECYDAAAADACLRVVRRDDFVWPDAV